MRGRFLIENGGAKVNDQSFEVEVSPHLRRHRVLPRHSPAVEKTAAPPKGHNGYVE
jgi:hypothetical protein